MTGSHQKIIPMQCKHVQINDQTVRKLGHFKEKGYIWKTYGFFLTVLYN